MIDPEKRKSVYSLHKEGVSNRKISKLLNISRNSVYSIVKQKGEISQTNRKDKTKINYELLTELYKNCNGIINRVHEILTEEYNVKIGYSTLTNLVRELEIRTPSKSRCSRVEDEPGVEMQHDTTIYRIMINEKKVSVIASILYYRYSKIRYLKFYSSFNRFAMKCFLHEALMYWGYCAKNCIIDNTNLARLRGTGKNAVIVPEMEGFAKRYGFNFICHEKGHANRKAGNERSFYTVETNFLTGRTFKSLEDINQQAFDWSTIRMANRPVSKTKLLPSKAFEYEQSYLIKVPQFVSAPYINCNRVTDQYGYASFEGNFYWIPGTKRHEVKILRYCKHIKIYYQRKMLIQYDLPANDVKNERIYPKEQPKPSHQPQFRKKSTAFEEKALRKLPVVNVYLNFAIKEEGKMKHNFIRRLYGLYKKITLNGFIQTIERALKYRIVDIETIERIAVLQIKKEYYEIPFILIEDELQSRENYQEGYLSDEVDLSTYDKLMEEDNE